MLSWKTHPVIRWLLTDARKHTDSSEFLDAFANELRMAGVDVSRITTGVPILHPQIFSFSGLWELGKQTSERLYRAGPEVSQTVANSPIRKPVRCDLTAPPRSGDFAILADLRRDGYTDYVVYPVPFADGSFKALSLATKRRGGFDDEDLTLFEGAIPALAFNLEVQALVGLRAPCWTHTSDGNPAGRCLKGKFGAAPERPSEP